MTDDIQTKIQKLELETVRAVTELQKDVQQLTGEVVKLATQIQKMTENYVTKEEYLEKMGDFQKDLNKVQRSGYIKSLMTGVISTIITAIVTFELMEVLKR